MASLPPLPSQIARIVLIGFMGAGKSTVGALLAHQLGWRFLDADRVIEERAQASIAEIFSRHGETKFRQMEADTIAELAQEDKLVLALGGGAIEGEATRRILGEASGTCIVFLEAPLEILIARCEQQPGAAVRPVLNDRERLQTRFDSRLPHYRAAHLVINTATLSADSASNLILQAVTSLIPESTSA